MADEPAPRAWPWPAGPTPRSYATVCPLFTYVYFTRQVPGLACQPPKEVGAVRRKIEDAVTDCRNDPGDDFA